MPGKEDYFLSFNRDEIFKGIVAVEGHFRNVKPGFEAGDLACIVKHLADVEGHCDEAISHSLIVEGKETSAKFQQLRDQVRELRRKVQKNEITSEEGIKKTRELRAFFEKFNPSYDVSACETCGPLPEETLRKLEETLRKLKQPTLRDLEEGMARRVIAALSEKYGVPPPKLEISDECHRPDVGLYVDGTIKVCRGGINIHVLSHEFSHYLQDRFGKPLDEAEAERFAVEVMQKNLYSRHAKYEGGEERLPVSVRDIALVYGGQHIGKGITRAMEYLDALYPGAVLGQDPSLIADIIGTVGGIVGGLYLRAPFDVLSVLIGGYMSTDLWRHAEKMVAPAAVRFVPAASPATTVSRYTVKPETVPAGTAPKGRYMITG